MIVLLFGNAQAIDGHLGNNDKRSANVTAIVRNHIIVVHPKIAYFIIQV